MPVLGCVPWKARTLNAIALPANPEFLILPSSDGQAKPGLGPDALPDSAQICSCNSVTKGMIAAAVGEACRRHGKRAGIPCAADQVPKYRALGFDFFNVISDFRCVAQGMKAALATARG